MRSSILCALLLIPTAGAFAQQPPTFDIQPANSKVTFFVKSSVTLEGTFLKWGATMKFTSNKASSGKLEIRIQADSVDTGNGMKNKTLKSDDFFAVDKNPEISFISTKITPIDANNFKVDGNFTIRGVSKPETLSLVVKREGDGTSGTITGTMSFNRKDFGMNKGIPFVKIDDRVDVTVNLKGKRTSGPQLLPE